MNASVNPDWSAEEIAAIQELSTLQDLPPTQVVRQALRTYQAIAKGAMNLVPAVLPPGCPDLSDEPKRQADDFLPDETIGKLFQGTKFGPQGETIEGQRALMADCVFKAFAGYGNGSTILRICQEAKLISPSGKPTADGARWAFKELHSRGNCFEERLKKLPR